MISLNTTVLYHDLRSSLAGGVATAYLKKHLSAEVIPLEELGFDILNSFFTPNHPNQQLLKETTESAIAKTWVRGHFLDVTNTYMGLKKQLLSYGTKWSKVTVPTSPSALIQALTHPLEGNTGGLTTDLFDFYVKKAEQAADRELLAHFCQQFLTQAHNTIVTDIPISEEQATQFAQHLELYPDQTIDLGIIAKNDSWLFANKLMQVFSIFKTLSKKPVISGEDGCAQLISAIFNAGESGGNGFI